MNIRLLIVITALALSLTACDKRISREIVGESREEVQNVSCTHTDFCFTCLPGFDMKTKCAFKMSNFCPGHQNARVRITPILDTYESGKIIKWNEVTTIDLLSVCK